MKYDLEERAALFGKEIIDFLKLLTRDKNEECRKLWKEAHQLTLIFAKICSSCDKKFE